MTEPYLIAHLVRGTPAFDIAERMVCPECGGYPHGGYPEDLDTHCSECDDLGYWWIIPTSGHRAYPYWSTALLLSPYEEDDDTDGYTRLETNKGLWTIGLVPQPPPNTPDHYPTRAAPKSAPSTNSLLATLSLHLPTSAPIKRRV